ncbi:hypothetical protein HDU88_000789 [Geranomyces variabilis]|nr:hypothetical protein HDU88_000789 [Geranomyces variabilis]
MSKHLFLHLSRAWRRPSAARRSQAHPSTERPASVATLSSSSGVSGRLPRRRATSLFACSKCTAGDVALAQTHTVDRVRKPVVIRRSYAEKSAPLAAHNDIVGGYTGAVEPPDGADEANPPIASDIGSVEAWTRFLQIKAMAADSSLGDGEQPGLRAIWNELVSQPPSTRGADRLRTVAIFMRQNGLVLSSEDVQHLISSHRVLRNWAEVVWEYQSLKIRADQGLISALLPPIYESAILAFLGLNLHEKAYAVVSEMRSDGAIPTVLSYTALLQDAVIRSDRQTINACVDDLEKHQVRLDVTCLAVLAVACEGSDCAERVHQLALAHDLQAYESDPDYHAAKGVLYSRVGYLNEAGSELEIIRQAVPQPTRPLIALYTAMIRASFFHEGSQGLNAAETLFTDMKALGLEPNVRTYTVLMHGYYKRRSAHDVLRIYEEMVAAGLQADATVHNIVLRTCVLHDDIYTMVEIFDRLVSTGVELPPHVLASVMAGFARCGEKKKAVEVFEQHLQGFGVRPDLTCYNVLILACGVAGDVSGCTHWWNRMLEQGLSPDKVSYTSFLHALSCAGDTRVETMYHRVFSTEVEPDALARELLIKDRLRRGDFEQAVRYFDMLLDSDGGAKQNISTGAVEALSRALRRRDDLPGAWKLIREYMDTGAQPDLKIYHALINLMRASSRPDEVINLWKGMIQERVEPDRQVYDSVLAAYAAQRDSEGLWAAVEDMRMRRIIPTVGMWEQIMQALTRDQRWSPEYLEHACRAIIQDSSSLTVTLFELLVEYALSADAPPDLLEEVISYCLQARRKGRTDDEEARLALYAFVFGPHGNQRWARTAVQTMVEQKEYRCLKEATRLLKESEDLDTLFDSAARCLQLRSSREADPLVNDLLDAVCGRAAERPNALLKVFRKALTTGEGDGGRPLRIMQALHAQEGGAELLHQCWKVAAAMATPAAASTASHVFAGFLDWAFLKRREPETVQQAWDFLVETNRSLLTLDIISVYVRFLASRNDADGIIQLATEFLTDQRLAISHRGAVVRNVLKLMRWKWPERVATVVDFWRGKEGVDSQELREEFL